MIAVIGGGPAGARAAELLAKHDKVTIFEEHSKVGLPVQCTGITTSYLASIIPVKSEFLVNKIHKVRVFSPDNNSVEFNLKNPNLVLDRSAFDNYLVGKALDNGAELLTNHRFLDSCYTNGKFVLNFKGNKKVHANYLVGADGPFSPVAKSNNMFGKRKYVVGVQARVNVPVDSDTVNFYLDKGFMGWLVPESEKIARVGIASSSNHNFFFKSFMNKVAGSIKVLDYQSGFIPVFNPHLKTEKSNVCLVGDAATQVKASTFGGLVQGLVAAEELSKAYSKGLSYERLWRKRLYKDLRISLMIRKKLDMFSSSDYNKLISLVGKDSVKNLLESHDRDFPSRFVLKILLKEPRLLRFLFI